MTRSVTVRTRFVVGAATACTAALTAALLITSPSYGAPAAAGPGGAPPATLPTTASATATTASTRTGPTTTTRSNWTDDDWITTTTTRTPCTAYTMLGAAPGGVLQSWTFENSTVPGWSGSGPTVAVSDAQAASGTHSLAVTGLDQGGYLATTIMSTANPDWYSVTAKVRLAPGASPRWLALKVDPGTQDTVPGYARATADGWTEVTAWYRTTTGSPANSCYPMTTGVSAPLRLSLALSAADCAAEAGPVNLYLDDVTVTRAPASLTGRPTAGPGPTCGSTTSTSTSPGTCRAGYTVVSQWPGGFQAGVGVTNLTDQTLTGWRVSWTLPAGETVTALWGAASWSQSAGTVTVTGPTWAPLGPGGTVTVGFVGSRSGSPQPLPVAVTLNGQSCPVS